MMGGGSRWRRGRRRIRPRLRLRIGRAKYLRRRITRRRRLGIEIRRADRQFARLTSKGFSSQKKAPRGSEPGFVRNDGFAALIESSHPYSESCDAKGGIGPIGRASWRGR